MAFAVWNGVGYVVEIVSEPRRCRWPECCGGAPVVDVYAPERGLFFTAAVADLVATEPAARALLRLPVK